MKKLIVIILLAVSFSVCSQSPKAPVEKIYISLDKPYHAAGEDLLYSVFVVDPVSHQLSNNGAVIFMDLLDPYGHPLLSQALNVEGGRDQGVFILPDTLSGGVYELVAYTNAMASSSAVSFKKVIIDGPGKLRKHKRDKVLTFRPEGGKLISGIENTVGVLAYDEVGEAIQCSGVVKNGKEQVVTKFTTSVNGVSSFNLLPVDSIYWSETIVNGTTIRTRIPVTKEGLTLHVDAGSDSLKLRLTGTPSEYGKKIKIKISSRGIINLETSAFVNPKGLRIKIPNSTILAGVALIEILNNKDQAEIKRFVYVTEQTKVETDITIPKNTIGTRENINVCFKSKELAPTEGMFSVSAFNTEFSPSDWQNMKQYLLFDSELGYSDQRNSFTGIYNQTVDRDNYLLSISPDSLPTYSAFNSSQDGPLNVITGQLMTNDNNPIGDTIMIASVIGSNQPYPILIFEKTDKNGNFKITLPPIQTNFTVFIKAKDVDETLSYIKYNINQKNPAPVTTQSLSTKHFELGKISGYYKIASENNLFETQYETKSIKKTGSAEGDFEAYSFSSFDASYELTEYRLVGSLREIADDIIPGIVVHNTSNGLSIRVSGKIQHTGKFERPFRQTALVLVDGVPVFNMKIIEAIPVSEMLRIEVAHGSYRFGKTNVYGVLSITTKSKGMITRQDLNHFRQTSMGFPSKTSFEFPNYKSKSVQSATIPDFRNLLYFNQAVKTNANGEGCFTLSTSDSQGNYKIFIEGITATGELVSAQQEFTVRNVK